MSLHSLCASSFVASFGGVQLMRERRGARRDVVDLVWGDFSRDGSLPYPLDAFFLFASPFASVSVFNQEFGLIAFDLRSNASNT